MQLNSKKLKFLNSALQNYYLTLTFIETFSIFSVLFLKVLCYSLKNTKDCPVFSHAHLPINSDHLPVYPLLSGQIRQDCENDVL